jgi:hypothetical protein
LAIAIVIVIFLLLPSLPLSPTLWLPEDAYLVEDRAIEALALQLLLAVLVRRLDHLPRPTTLSTKLHAPRSDMMMILSTTPLPYDGVRVNHPMTPVTVPEQRKNLEKNQKSLSSQPYHNRNRIPHLVERRHHDEDGGHLLEPPGLQRGVSQRADQVVQARHVRVRDNQHVLLQPVMSSAGGVVSNH